jgi:hypothetical protein
MFYQLFVKIKMNTRPAANAKEPKKSKLEKLFRFRKNIPYSIFSVVYLLMQKRIVGFL